MVGMYAFSWFHIRRSCASIIYTWGDNDVISVPACFCRHLVGKTLRNVFHCDIAEIERRLVTDRQTDTDTGP